MLFLKLRRFIECEKGHRKGEKNEGRKQKVINKTEHNKKKKKRKKKSFKGVFVALFRFGFSLQKERREKRRLSVSVPFLQFVFHLSSFSRISRPAPKLNKQSRIQEKQTEKERDFLSLVSFSRHRQPPSSLS